MNKTLRTPFSSLCLLLLLAGTGCGFASTHNDLKKQENALVACFQNAMIEYDTYWKTISEQAQVTDAYKDAFLEAMQTAAAGRYEGKDPAMLVIQEANPNLSPEMYQQLQRTIEAGRQGFAQSQRNCLDRQRALKDRLVEWPESYVVEHMGFPSPISGQYAPKEDIDGDGKITVLDYRIVTSTKTEQTFATGHEEAPVDLFPQKKPEGQ